MLGSSHKGWSKFVCIWSSPPDILNIGNNEVHIWLIPLELSLNRIQQMEKILSFDEKRKASNFYFERHRKNYIARHASLRKILAKYSGIDPDQLQFTVNKYGKPALISNGNMESLNFNLSRSNEFALCAVTFKRSVGIDIEYIGYNSDIESIAKHFFTADEYETILSFSFDQRQNVFLDMWTLKEAYLKATGEGIRALKSVEFSFIPNVAPTLINNEDWTILQLMPLKGYTAGMVIAEKGLNHIRFYKL